MFLWKAWMYKLVMLYSHQHLQFHILNNYANFFFNWPRTLSEESCFQKKSKNSFQPIFKSLNVILRFYTGKLSMREIVSSPFPFSLDVVGNLLRWKRLCDFLRFSNLQPMFWRRFYTEISKRLKCLFLISNDKQFFLSDQAGFLSGQNLSLFWQMTCL